MPKIGEVKRGKEVGIRSRNKFVWVACKNCGRERWVQINYGKPMMGLRCKSCRSRGSNNNQWKGGKVLTKDGYLRIWLPSTDFFFPMTAKGRGKFGGYVLEHRLVVAKHLNRCLLPWEMVHHKGAKFPLGSIEDKQDNRYPENLQLVSDKRYHMVDAMAKAYIRRLERRINELEKRLAN